MLTNNEFFEKEKDQLSDIIHTLKYLDKDIIIDNDNFSKIFTSKKDIADLFLYMPPVYIFGTLINEIFKLDREDVLVQVLLSLEENKDKIENVDERWNINSGMWSKLAHSFFWSASSFRASKCLFAFIDFCSKFEKENVKEIIKLASVSSASSHNIDDLKILHEKYKVDLSSIREKNQDLLGSVFFTSLGYGFAKKGSLQDILSCITYLALSGCNPSGIPDETGYVYMLSNPLYSLTNWNKEAKEKCGYLLIDFGASLDDLVYIQKGSSTNKINPVSVGSILKKQDKDFFDKMKAYEDKIKKIIEDKESILHEIEKSNNFIITNNERKKKI